MRVILVLSVSLVLIGVAASRKLRVANDAVSNPKQDTHRIKSRSSAALFTPANSGVGIPYSPGDSSYGYLALSLAGLGPRGQGHSLSLEGQGQGSSLRQPLKPVYHATPLEPYGSLLQNARDSYQRNLVKPIVEKPEEDPPHYVSSGGLTEAVLHKAVTPPRSLGTYSSHGGHSLGHSRGQAHESHDDAHYAAKYQFGYQVRDPKGGNFFGHSEARDGHSTKGQYHVFLPDGRLQHVQYWTDPSGYHAEISYNRPATTHHGGQ